MIDKNTIYKIKEVLSIFSNEFVVKSEETSIRLLYKNTGDWFIFIQFWNNLGRICVYCNNDILEFDNFNDFFKHIQSIIVGKYSDIECDICWYKNIIDNFNGIFEILDKYNIQRYMDNLEKSIKWYILDYPLSIEFYKDFNIKGIIGYKELEFKFESLNDILNILETLYTKGKLTPKETWDNLILEAYTI